MRPDRHRPAIDDRVRVEHMLQAAKDAIGYVSARERADLESDSMLLRALTNAVQQIGEAAARVSDPGRARVPGVPWGEIVAMRHILVHVYWGIDRDRLWSTVAADLPTLVEAIEAAIVDWPLPDVERE